MSQGRPSHDRHVSFRDEVTVHVFDECNDEQFTTTLEAAPSILRTLWHLDGDCCSAAVAWDVVHAWQRIPIEDHVVIEHGHGSSVLAVAPWNCCGDRRSQYIYNRLAELSIDSQPHRTLWRDILPFIEAGPPTRTAHFVEVWYLHSTRHELCLQSRRVKLNLDWTETALQKQLVAAWIDLFDLEAPCALHFVHPSPCTLRATVAHVIVLQDPTQAVGSMLLRMAPSLAGLTRHRAVIVKPMDRVWNLLARAHSDVDCDSVRVQCTLQLHDTQTLSIADRVPLLHGALVAFNAVIAHADDGLTTSESSTDVPSDSTEEDVDSEDLTSFMHSSTSGLVGAAQTPIVHGLVDQIQNEPDDEVECPSWPALQTNVQLRLEAGAPEDQPWIAVTFGVALTDLGRRDVEFLPRQLHMLPEMIAHTWEDHLAYGAIQIEWVDPQPTIRLAHPYVVLLVVNIGPYPEATRQLGEHVARADELHVALHFLQQAGVDAQEQVCVECHGISPSNRPLGSRQMWTSIARLGTDGWLAEIRALWPFDTTVIEIAYAFTVQRNGRMGDGPATIHMIVSYMNGPGGTPVLIEQGLVAYQETFVQEELWAVRIPFRAGQLEIAMSLSLPPFWIFDDVPVVIRHHHHIVSSVPRPWMAGTLFHFETMVETNEDALELLTSLAQSAPTDRAPDFHALLQIHMKVQARAHRQPSAPPSEVDHTNHDKSVPSDAEWSWCQYARSTNARPAQAIEPAHSPTMNMTPYVTLPILEESILHTEVNTGLRSQDHSQHSPTLQWDEVPLEYRLEDACPSEFSWMPHANRFEISLEDCIEVPRIPLHHVEVSMGPLHYIRNMLLTLSLPPVHSFDCDIAWHPATVEALQHTPVWDGQNATGLSFFIDGSARFHKEADQSKAAAAVVLIVHTLQGDQFGGFRTWALSPPSNSQHAEHAAVTGAILWIISLLQRFGSFDWIEVFSDCTAAFHAAEGTWKINHDSRFGHLARSFQHFIEQHFGAKCHYSHVAAHRGHPWNEAADTIAAAVADGQFSTWTLEETLAPLSLDGQYPDLIHWAWFLSSIEQTAPHCLDLKRNVMYLDVQSPFQTNPKPVEVLRTEECEMISSSGTQHLTLTCATANVLTLFPGTKGSQGYVSARQEALMADLSAQHIHVCGIQEARNKAPLMLRSPEFRGA
eukprot:Skav232859  [mRNA]  locus=scaffold2451:150408:154866:- [translate_table: standard]